MTLTTNQLYCIAQKIYNERFAESATNSWRKNLARKNSLIYLEGCGEKFTPIFKKSSLGNVLYLTENEGRIYYYYNGQGREYPVSDEVLKDFPLTPDGEKFLKPYLKLIERDKNRR